MRQVTEYEIENRLRLDNESKGKFAKRHKLARNPLVTTRTVNATKTIGGVDIDFVPCSLHCYTVGKNTLERSGSR